jgi:zinc protease
MLDRTVAPPYVQSTSFDLLTPERTTLPNGIDLFFITGGSQEVLKIELVFNAGRWHEEAWGAAYFTSHLLSKGTKRKSSFDIARIFDLYGAHLEVNPGLDFVSISLYALTKNLEPVLSLLKEILSEPTFPEKEIEQAKSIYLQNLKVNEEKTSFLASKYFRKQLFGDAHPYGKELEEADIEKLTSDDFRKHFSKFLVKPVIFASGKIDSMKGKLIHDAFASWPSGTPTDRSFLVTEPTLSRSVIEKEESVQSSIRLGMLSVQRQHVDYSKIIFVSHILGGYFGSRLMKNIREEKGLTYGIYSSVNPLKRAGYVVIGADVNKENVTLTFDEIRKELHRLRTEPVSSEELNTARNHFIGSLQSEINNPFAHADKIKTLYLFDLASTYYQQMIHLIAGITGEQVQEISALYFHEEKFFELAVG